jgi:hypothetical protein
VISTLLSASFPEIVQKLVLIDGITPMSKAPDTAPAVLRNAILDFEKLGSRTLETSRRHESLEAAIQARLETVQRFPGNQTLSRYAAETLVKR